MDVPQLATTYCLDAKLQRRKNRLDIIVVHLTEDLRMLKAGHHALARHVARDGRAMQISPQLVRLLWTIVLDRLTLICCHMNRMNIYQIVRGPEME